MQQTVDPTQLFVQQIKNIVDKSNYSRVVLQMPKEMLKLSFSIVSTISKLYANTQFFVLYDSLKQPCCLDILGAEHVGYDCLIHFGKACFSSPHQPNHFYIFDAPSNERIQSIKAILQSQHLIKQVLRQQIGYLAVDQKYYQCVRNIVLGNQSVRGVVKILKLAYDATEKDEYLAFGYYKEGDVKEQGLKNIMVITDNQFEEENNQMNLCQKIALVLKSLNQKVGQKLYFLGDQQRQPVVQFKSNLNKKLMQRYSMISQLQNYKTFGLIVSNTATSFFQNSMDRALAILKKHGKKCFSFMMNNLNQVKLGNFPQIQVYVIISCFNHSLFALKDFHRLVVTPTDLQVAFEHRSFDDYLFDCKAKMNDPIPIAQSAQVQQASKLGEQVNQLQLDHTNNRQITLQSKIQTLDYYKQREFKGLTFQDRKQVKKMTKGKIGLAQQYTQLK